MTETQMWVVIGLLTLLVISLMMISGTLERIDRNLGSKNDHH